MCRLDLICGLGCQLHHVTYCLIVAYGERWPAGILTTVPLPMPATTRTLILQSKGWRYNKKGFEEVFLPLSETCRDPSGEE